MNGGNLLRDAAIFVVASIAIAAAALGWHPDDWLIGEDRLLETLSAILYACASLFAASLLIRLGRGAHPALWFVAVFGMVCALDEISFGARLLDIEMPPMEGGGEFDGAHDVIIVAVRALRAMPAPARWLAVGGTLVLCLVAAIMLRRLILVAAEAVLADPVLLRIAICGTLLVFAQALDVDLFVIPRQMYFEEWAETSAGYWLLVSAFAAPRASRAWHRTIEWRLRSRPTQANSAIAPTANRIA